VINSLFGDRCQIAIAGYAASKGFYVRLELIALHHFLQLYNMIFRSQKISMHHSITLEQLTVASDEYALLVG